MSQFLESKRCKECGYDSISIAKTGDKNPNWNPDREYVKVRHKVSKTCRNVLKQCLRYLNVKKVSKTEILLGYTRRDLYNHIISHPNWLLVKNEDWHLDHIFPIKAFIEHGITDLKIINALENLRPITKKENLIKGDSYDLNEFKDYIKKFGIII